MNFQYKSTYNNETIKIVINDIKSNSKSNSIISNLDIINKHCNIKELNNNNSNINLKITDKNKLITKITSIKNLLTFTNTELYIIIYNSKNRNVNNVNNNNNINYNILNNYIHYMTVSINKYIKQNKLIKDSINNNNNNNLDDNYNKKESNTKHSYLNYTILIILIFITIAIIFIKDIDIINVQLKQNSSNEIKALQNEYKLEGCPSDIPALKQHCMNIEARIENLNKTSFTTASILVTWLVNILEVLYYRLGLYLFVMFFILFVIGIKLFKTK